MELKSLAVFSILLYFICFSVTVHCEEDLAILEQDVRNDDESPDLAHPYGYQRDYENYDDLVDEDGSSAYEDDDSASEVDETHVLVLKESNFTDFIEKNRFVMVEFYAPWCGHCQALAPEYADAATELKDEEVTLAKVHATEESELAQKFDVQGYPTIYFFVNGVHRLYSGQRTRNAIVTWLRKKIGPGLQNITTVEEAQGILSTQDKLVLGYLESLLGSNAEEFRAASMLEDDVNFYQTTIADVAKLFNIDPIVKCPALVVLKNETEKFVHFDGPFTKSEIAKFVYEHKFPLITNLTRETAPQVFDNPIKKQLILFTTSSDSEKLYPTFLEAAKFFKGKLLCVYVELGDEDPGKEVSEYFGVSGDTPQVIAYTGNDDARKFLLEGELTVSSIKSFGEDFLQDNLHPFYKSDRVPDINDGDVKLVVGKNFDDIVLDESKDVLLEIYAPWCGHCQSLEPIYNKLGKHLRGIESIVIAKMDGTTNEHPRAKTDGFPTLLFFPAGNKSFDPITFDDDRTVVAFYKFLKKHAAIPFKLRKPSSAEKSTISSDAVLSHDPSSSDVKDEL